MSSFSSKTQMYAFLSLSVTAHLEPVVIQSFWSRACHKRWLILAQTCNIPNQEMVLLSTRPYISAALV